MWQIYQVLPVIEASTDLSAEGKFEVHWFFNSWSYA